MIKKYLDLSTAHVPESEWKRMGDLDALPDHDVLSLVFVEHPYSYGRWVWVPPNDADMEEITRELPTLVKVMEYARNSDCAWINFDQDADTVEGLPTFDW